MNEIFGPTIQGEGKSLGKEVLFLRLALCNLDCHFCDTPYSWDWKRFDYKKEVHNLSNAQIVEELLSLRTRSLVVSGGEPMIQQEGLIELFEILKRLDYWIEVETNGTFKPLPRFLGLVDQINCSPKMENSGVEFKKRLKPLALGALSQSGKTNFKFVVSSEADIKDILTYVKFFDMKEVYLMPEGKTLDELQSRQEFVREVCEKYGFNFTNREHIIQFGSRRGV